MCRRHIFSRKREGGTARKAWGVPSGQYAGHSPADGRILPPQPKAKRAVFRLFLLFGNVKGFEPEKVSALIKCAGGTFLAGSARAVPHAKRGVSRAGSMPGAARQTVESCHPSHVGAKFALLRQLFMPMAKKVVIRPLPCSSFPNRTRCAGLRFGLLDGYSKFCFDIKIKRKPALLLFFIFNKPYRT